jgi:hypothetical protein
MDVYSYERNMTRLGPVLRRLAQVSNVIWWNQYPTIDMYAKPLGKEDIFSETLHLYNNIAKRVLR